MGKKNINSIYTTSIDRWTNNVLILLGSVQWSQKQLKKIINTLIPLLERRTNNTDFYDNIQTFLTVNEILYKKSHPDMLRILDVMLEKINKGELNGYDQQVMHSNYLQSIYILSKNHNYTYENTDLLNSALKKIQQLGNDWKKFITESLLLNIRRIGSCEVVEILDKFVINDVLNLPLTTEKDIMERLHLVANGYPIPEGFLGVINEFVCDNIPGKLGELDFIMAGVEDNFPKLINYLVKERGFVEFQGALDMFNERVRSLKK